MIRWLTILALTATLGGCSTEPESGGDAGSAVVVQAVAGELLAGSWPARMAHDDQRSRFESQDGWRHMFEYDLSLALVAFSVETDPRGLSRVHEQLAALYTQGAFLAANATVEAYGEGALETDPDEVVYLLGVSEFIRGDRDAALKHFSEVAPSSVFALRTGLWMGVLANPGMPSLEVLTSVSGTLGEVVPGQEPAALPVPHFELKEKSEKGRLMGANDPTALLTRAAWHRAAAVQAAPESDQAALGQFQLRYGLDRSRSSDEHAALELDDAWLFCSSNLSATDAAFVAEAMTQGISAVSKWADKSVLAAAVAPAIQDGKVDPQAVMDAGFGLQKQAQRMMADIAGAEAGFHRPFAQRARIAVLQAGMIVADANDQYRDAGILRLNALERMETVGVEPVFALSVAAWDAGNRSPLRPEEILHQFRSTYPALSAAKAPLEALHLRRSRNAGPANPVH